MTGKRSKCPLIEEWIKGMWYICTMECYSAIKRNKVGLFVETLMDLKTAIQEKKRKKKEKKRNIVYYHIYVESRKKYRLTYLQSRNRETDIEKQHMSTKVEKEGGANWEIGINMYTLLCI